jgi:radical SAM protein with 4Fe4S-binding SPASM domain
MNTLSYSDFSSKIHAASSGKRIPLNASIDLTFRCNNRCVHCYCNLPEHDATAKSSELTTEEVKKLLDGLASLGTLWLLITGGEPLLREDFEEIYMYAKQKGFLITFFTNGTLIDDKTVKLLSKYPPFVVEISLYGATEETYEKVTRVKGSYDRCMKGIKKIVNAGIKLKLKTMALIINQHEIEAMDRLARELGCEFRFDPILNKRIDDNAFSDPVQYRISPEDVVRLDKAYPKRMEEWERFCDKFVVEPVRDNRLYKCGAGLGMIHIDPPGIVKGCMMMKREGFSLREYDLKWIWDEGIPSVITLKKDSSLSCDDCHLAKLCGQCPAWSLLENEDMNKEVEYLCKIAKIRQRDFTFLNEKVGRGKDDQEEMVKAGV